MKISPCKDCEKRYLGCRDHCDDYKTWSKETHDAKAKLNMERMNCRSTATSKKYRRRQDYSYDNREQSWMKNKH